MTVAVGVLLEILYTTAPLAQMRRRDTTEEEEEGSSICLSDTQTHARTRSTLSLLLSRMSTAISSTAACHTE